ncbi:DUF3891 family protein [Paenibacillus gallinarum]|uniref:DUF3891 family protein n=1 Tax=Paenibacillus gallinarum TaxID=2762232 RepID=A0ABR8T4T4_9BACL|nr:DUF3891 family protein [Paenibacillus gallinarum]MBD7970765.1 DUF3891 family protein [Paenibacillus gallinarum]
MVIREQVEHFIMIEQHEHARLSGEIAKHLKPEYFIHEKDRQDVIYAITQHDRGWIRLDAHPIWNEVTKAPYYFVDYPYAVKLKMYQTGIQEVETVNPYAGYLVSHHFSTFPDIKNGTDPFSISFNQEEKQRQEQLEQQLGSIQETEMKQHYHLLQLCDDLSLYVCMNEPGVSKEKEHPWFQNGLGSAAVLFQEGKESVQAFWKDEYTVEVQPAPFRKSFETELSYRKVAKKDIQDKGLNKAFHETEQAVQKITYTS